MIKEFDKGLAKRYKQAVPYMIAALSDLAGATLVEVNWREEVGDFSTGKYDLTVDIPLLGGVMKVETEIKDGDGLWWGEHWARLKGYPFRFATMRFCGRKLDSDAARILGLFNPEGTLGFMTNRQRLETFGEYHEGTAKYGQGIVEGWIDLPLAHGDFVVKRNGTWRSWKPAE